MYIPTYVAIVVRGFLEYIGKHHIPQNCMYITYIRVGPRIHEREGDRVILGGVLLGNFQDFRHSHI